MFLKPPQPTKSTRQRRGAGAGVGLAALAAVRMSAALPICKILLLIMLRSL